MFSSKVYLICGIVLLFVNINYAQEAILQSNLGLNAVAIEWSPDGSLIAVSTEAGVKLYDTNLEETATLPDYSQQVVSLSWSPDSQRIAGVGYPYEAGVQIWIPVFTSSLLIWERDENNNFSLIQQFDYPDQENIIGVEWSPNGEYLAAQTSEYLPGSDTAFGSIEIWDTTTWEIDSNLQITLREMYADMAWSPDSTHLASGGEAWCYELRPCDNPALEINGHIVFVMDITTGAVTTHQEIGWWVYGIVWSAMDKIAVVGYELEIYDSSLSQQLLRTDTPQDAEYRLILLPNQAELIVWSLDSKIDIVDLASLESQVHLEIPELEALSLSPDGLYLAALTLNHELLVYELPPRDEVTN